MTQTVLLKDLLFLPELQARAGGISTSHVTDMLATLQSGEELKPPVGSPASFRVFRLADGRMVVTDGWHAGEAHKRHGSDTVTAEVIDGTWEEAIWDASGRNVTHGLKRTNEDKERAISLALHSKPSSSNQLIAAHCRVSDSLVARVRAELEDAEEIPVVEKRVGADGKERVLPTVVPTPRVEPEPEPFVNLPENEVGLPETEELASGDDGTTSDDEKSSEGVGDSVEPVAVPVIPARRSVPPHFKPGHAVDPDHPYAELLSAIVSLAGKISRECNDSPVDSKIRQYLANVGFVLPRAVIKGDKHIGWKCIGLRGVYRVVRLAGSNKKALTKEQVRKEFEKEGDEL